MYSAKTQRRQPHSFDTVLSGQLQPGSRCFAVIGAGALADQYTNPSVEAAGNERDDTLARCVHPLHVVDCDQHGGFGRQPFEDREECRPDDPKVAWGTPAAGPQQDAIHCNTLDLRQPAHYRAVDIAD